MMATYINNNGFTSTRAGYLDNINNSNLSTIVDISSLTSTEIAKLTNLNITSGGMIYADAGEQILSYPLLAEGVDLSSNATAWNWGSYVEIVPASTITSDFLILGFTFREGGIHQFIAEIAKGGAGSEVTVNQIACNTTEKTGEGQSGLILALLPKSILVEANSRIAMRLGASDGSSVTYDDFKIIYMEV